MFRSITTFGLILTFIVALQNNSEYWVINRALCMEKMAESCQKAPEDCASACGSDIQCADAESDCKSASTGADDCSVTDTRPVCLELNCASKSQSLPCCILIRPFWGEAQSRLNLTPDHSIALLATAERLHQPSFELSRLLTVNPDPPWGVHPTIATTVLRI